MARKYSRIENIVERIVILTCDDEVGIADLPHFLQAEPNPVEAIRLDLPPNGIASAALRKRCSFEHCNNPTGTSQWPRVSLA